MREGSARLKQPEAAAAAAAFSRLNQRDFADGKRDSPCAAAVEAVVVAADESAEALLTPDALPFDSLLPPSVDPVCA